MVCVTLCRYFHYILYNYCTLYI